MSTTILKNGYFNPNPWPNLRAIMIVEERLRQMSICHNDGYSKDEHTKKGCKRTAMPARLVNGELIETPVECKGYTPPTHADAAYLVWREKPSQYGSPYWLLFVLYKQAENGTVELAPSFEGIAA